MNYPKRLIEVDLPIKRISAHARREKSIRHGHISTLHIWWARRPLAACRAVILASLWPDPADPNCPVEFLNAARQTMQEWTTHERQILLSPESRRRFDGARKNPALFDEPVELRGALLDFVADFSDWGNSSEGTYLATSRTLTAVAHEALGGVPGSRPLVLDPFAGGGSIPLEAARVGADAFASDLNPIPVLLNKLTLDYIPKHRERLAHEVRKWGAWVKQKAEEKLKDFYPPDPDGSIPITYLWARTIRCEGPGCGAEIPLMRSLWLAKKQKRSSALLLVPDKATKNIGFKIITKQGNEWVDQTDFSSKFRNPALEGTIKRGSVTCPCCGYTTQVARVRDQLKGKRGGIYDARLVAVVLLRPGADGRQYRLPTEADAKVYAAAAKYAIELSSTTINGLSPIPNETTIGYHTFVNRGPIYGLIQWGDYFLPRQAVAIATIGNLIQEAGATIAKELGPDLGTAVSTALSLCADKVVDLANGCCGWEPVAECPRHLFARQAIPMVWDFAEGVPIGESSGAFQIMVDRFAHVLESIGSDWKTGHVEQASATNHPLPNDSVDAFITDPPYYYSVQYADLSDFFYVWLRRWLRATHPGLFDSDLIGKDQEIIVQSPGHQFSPEGKNNAFYERQMCVAMGEGRRVLTPSGIGVVVFAHTSTAGWEAMLQAMLDAGWVIVASWPIDTEMATRVIAQGRSVLGSSVHIVCRPRENPDGSLRSGDIGDWRDVLAELPRRIHEWMPRLAEEGVVGADAIFACLGPALEIFSRYSKVEKASGEVVTLREYLEQVWAAVAKEALAQVFKDADTAGFEPDARLTAMWLWTLNAGASDDEESASENDQADGDDDEDGKSKGKAKGGFVLEFDAARKIAQGLGASLEDLSALIEVTGDSARLLPVSERTRHLFGKDQEDTPAPGRKKKAAPQLDLFAELSRVGADETAWKEKTVQKIGETTLDRIHQSMILFATGRGEALKRFLVDDGAGKDQRFWRLAQALSALYPASTSEKRWVDGVLARKKGLGL